MPLVCDSNELIIQFDMERRKYPRKPYGANAFLLVEDQEYSCIVKNISKGGALLTVDVLPQIEIGELVDIRIPFSNSERYVEKAAKITRINGNTIAIQFCDIPHNGLNSEISP